MHITDPVADLLTRIGSASRALQSSGECLASKIIKAIVQILMFEVYIVSSSFTVDD